MHLESLSIFGGRLLGFKGFFKLIKTKIKFLKFAAADDKIFTPVEIKVNFLNVLNFAKEVFPCGWLTKTVKSSFCYNL